MPETDREIENEYPNLERVREDIDTCTICEEFAPDYEKPPSMERGPEDALVMVIGQGPANAEVEKGEPFAGQSGTRLDNWLVKAGAPSDDPRRRVFLTSVIKCAADTKTTIFRRMAKNCGPFLKHQLQLIEPELVITLGGRAYDALRPTEDPYKNARFNFYDTNESQLFPKLGYAYTLLPWPHPSGRNRLLNETEVRNRLIQSCQDVEDYLSHNL